MLLLLTNGIKNIVDLTNGATLRWQASRGTCQCAVCAGFRRRSARPSTPGKFLLLPATPPCYYFPRVNIHTRGNIWSFAVD